MLAGARKRSRSYRSRASLGPWVLLALLIAPLSAFAQPRYTFDVDPIRLGMKALESRDLDQAAAKFNEAVAAGYQVDKAHYGLAEVAVHRGRYARADSLYHLALKDRVHTGSAAFPEAHAGLGLLLLRLGRNTEAKAQLDQALAEKHDLWEAVYGKARLALAGKDWDQAKKLLSRGAKRKGLAEGEDLYHYGMALYDLGTGDLDAAEKEALIAQSFDPAEPLYAEVLARVYQKRDVPSLAVEAYEKALAAPGMRPTAPLFTDLGNLYEDMKRYNDARDAYTKALGVDSTYAPALGDLADLYRRAGQDQKAAAAYLAYVKQVPDDVDAQIGLADALLKVGSYGQALDAARRAMALDSTRTEVRLTLARAGLRGADEAGKAQAAAIFASLPDSVLDDPKDLMALADYLSRQKEYDRARSRLLQAKTLDPASAEIRYRLGILEMGAGRPDSAAAHLERAAALDSTSALYRLNLGVAYLQAGKYREAIAPFRGALALDDSLTIGRVLLGQALVMSDSTRAAEREYERAVKSEPHNARALRGLGYCYIRRSDFKGAARAYKAAADAEPKNADAWAGLGNAYLGLQDFDAAEKAFEKARAIDPKNPTLVKGWELLQKARSGGG
jgi:tetratricopeptide (TPR) repeat protein